MESRPEEHDLTISSFPKYMQLECQKEKRGKTPRKHLKKQKS